MSLYNKLKLSFCFAQKDKAKILFFKDFRKEEQNTNNKKQPMYSHAVKKEKSGFGKISQAEVKLSTASRLVSERCRRV